MEKCPKCGSENFEVCIAADHCPDCGYYFYYPGASLDENPKEVTQDAK